MEDKNKKILKNYISSQRERGVKDEDLKNALLEAGWEEENILMEFNELDRETSFLKKKERGLGNEVNREEKLEEPIQVSEDNRKEEKEKPEMHQKKKDSQPVKKTEPMGVYSFQKPYKNLNVIKEVDESFPNKKTPLSSGSGESFFRVSLVVVITVVIMGCISVAAYYILQDILGEEELKNLSKEDVITEALVSYMKDRSVHHKTKSTFSIGEILEIKATAAGFIQKEEGVMNPYVKTDFDIEIKIKEEDLEKKMDMAGNFILVEGVFYVYFDHGLNIPFVNQTSLLEDKWISFEKNKDLNVLEREGNQVGVGFDNEIIKVAERYGSDFFKKAQESDFMKIRPVTHGEDFYRYEIDLYPEKTSSFVRSLTEALPFGAHKKSVMEFADEIEKEWQRIEHEMETDETVIYLELNIEKETKQIGSLSINFEGFSVTLKEEKAPLSFYLRTEIEKPDAFLVAKKPEEILFLKDFFETEDIFKERLKVGTSSDSKLSNEEDLLTESKELGVETSKEDREVLFIRNFLRAGAAWFDEDI